jgi:two-component system, chemotaxis family, protein-glutamate methylesterase/glutaminase
VTERDKLERRLRNTEIVVIGASMGGTHAIPIVLQGLPGEFEAPIAIAQHRHATSTQVFTNLIGRGTRRSVCDAEDNMPIEKCRTYVAPADYHLLLERGRCRLSVDDRVQYTRPSIDVLFESAADSYRQGVTAILLTGANADGASGTRAVRKHGGIVIVQDPSTAEASAMPESGRKYADIVLPLEEISTLFVNAMRYRTDADGAERGRATVRDRS